MPVALVHGLGLKNNRTTIVSSPNKGYGHKLLKFRRNIGLTAVKVNQLDRDYSRLRHAPKFDGWLSIRTAYVPVPYDIARYLR